MKKALGGTEDDRLQAIRTRQYEAARGRMLDGDFEGASAHLDEAELVDRLTRLGSHGRSPPIFALIVIGACGLLVFAAWKTRVSSFAELEVSIRAETTAARLTLAHPAAFESFRGAAVDVGRLSTLTAEICDVPAKLTNDGWVRIQGSPVEIRGLRAAERVSLVFGLVAVSGHNPTLTLRAYGKGIDGEILVRPGALVSTGEADRLIAPETRLSGDVVDVVSFGCGDCQEAPLRLDLREADPFAFGNVPVGELGFGVDHVQPDGTTYFTSGLRAGSVRVLDANRVEAIEAGDSLKLVIGKARRFQIGRAVKGDTLSFVYEGTVKRLSLGPLNAERDLSPSLLEFLYRQKALALLWGAAVFLWGLFVGIRRLWQAKTE
jgi:hypothetical protein